MQRYFEPDQWPERKPVDERNSKTLRRLVYHSGPLTVRVPKGFVTDFASVPRFLWWGIPPTGKYDAPAVLHDYLYRDQSVSRVVADALFVEAMGCVGVTRWRRLAMYVGVRVGGWMAWRSNARRQSSSFRASATYQS